MPIENIIEARGAVAHAQMMLRTERKHADRSAGYSDRPDRLTVICEDLSEALAFALSEPKPFVVAGEPVPSSSRGSDEDRAVSAPVPLVRAKITDRDGTTSGAFLSDKDLASYRRLVVAAEVLLIHSRKTMFRGENAVRSADMMDLLDALAPFATSSTASSTEALDLGV